MSTLAIGAGIVVATIVIIALAAFLLVINLFKKVNQGQALIVSKSRKVDVTFTGAVVLPIVHRAEFMDISVKTIEIGRLGRDGLICKDNIRADIRITFFVRVNKTREDVVKVAQAIGTARASDQTTLQELFAAKFSEALKTVGKHLDFTDLYTHRDEFRDRIIAVIGTDLNGYSLEDAAIDYLEQTPLNQLDAQNILDAQGIRKITELTAIEHVSTNQFRRTEEKEITKQNVESREAILALERQQADAENRQRREVETLRAREEAEIERVRAEEALKARTAQLRTDEAVGVQNENKNREIAVAEKNRERVIAIEAERIEKDRLLEVADRDRAVSLATISNERELETERRGVAEVVRERVAVDKTVAEQEEQINRVRTVEAAERDRQAIIIRAEAQAQEHLVKDIKAAEAAEAAAKFQAKQALTLAESEQQTAELQASAKIRLAEAQQAESAAYGLGQAQVKVAEAEAVEQVGRAEAAALRERNLATAQGLRETALAEAEGTREKLKGEAEGLQEKAGAMAAMDAATREHEEYRLRLELEKEVELAKIQTHREVAESQAKVLATGLEHANIDIVGGDSVFLDRITGSIGLARGLDNLLESDAGTAVTSLAGSLLAGKGAASNGGTAPKA